MGGSGRGGEDEKLTLVGHSEAGRCFISRAGVALNKKWKWREKNGGNGREVD